LAGLYAECRNSYVGEILCEWLSTSGKQRMLEGMAYLGHNNKSMHNTINRALNKIGKDGFDILCDHTLDLFQIYSHITAFVKTHLKVYKWDELDDDTMKLCFKGYPEREVPIWDDSMEAMLH
jgi:hypothetical protein